MLLFGIFFATFSIFSHFFNIYQSWRILLFRGGIFFKNPPLKPHFLDIFSPFLPCEKDFKRVHGMLVTIFHPFLCPFFDHPRKFSPLIKYAKKCGTGIVLPANQFTNMYNKKAYQTLLVDFFMILI